MHDSAIRNSANVSEYPTTIKLCYQKNDEDNGKLLAALEKWGDTYPTYESNDDAKKQNIGVNKNCYNAVAMLRNQATAFLFK